MKKILIVLILFTITTTAHAYKEWGNVNDYFSYDDLIIRKITNPDHEHFGRYVIAGHFENRTKVLYDSIWWKVYAYDDHKQFLWSKVFYFSTVPAKQEIPFAGILPSGIDPDPFTLEFKVQD